MISLDNLLYGVQPRTTRQAITLPPPWANRMIGPVVTDSREVTLGSLFVALTGERTDGHRFLPDVVARGAAAALVSPVKLAALAPDLSAVARPWQLVEPTQAAILATVPPDACLLIAVDDPLFALQRVAVYHRRMFTPTVIGITGSVGKTSTKEVVAAVLSQRFRTLKSQRSFNSEVTLPATLLGLTADHQVAVLEMGMWAAGEIRFLASLARPQIGIVTNVGPSHLERLGSIEAIANAKAELPESLPADGWCILNADDPRVKAMATRTAARVLTYGYADQADVRLLKVESYGLHGIGLAVEYNGQQHWLRTPLIGRHHAYTALAAIATALVLGLDWEAIAAGLREPGEQLRLRVVRGRHGVTIIDDTYNAAPLSTIAALQVLAETEGRRIAVLGEMLELGAASEEGHQQVGAAAATAADLLIAVGRQAQIVADAARRAGMTAEQVKICADNEAAIRLLNQLIQAGDCLLVKGSRGVQMETIVVALTRTES
ncbi:MAG: UDP-N-acetylmuramoyl-tripeptide--D-alanyl-D-alanine ligase [Chloroflexus sp.]|nr:UDP-N-acetylmuramoyl-tripeptide--D-alanyl-D-alanine ligase [Chloroflexus sp.]